MKSNESPMTKTTSSSSMESVKNWEHKYCLCGRRARVNTSWTLKNLGRRFYTCATPKGVLGCHYFEWFDEDFTGIALDLITHLNHMRIYLEEKLKLVEETLAQSYEKKGLGS
ncbi:GRF-type domain-containing protein [Heracleum sosnowskyi]|uniref:GRF-type domain-containing protein n=1 Tax=Heracleum sosnowskyi TaxID=360622 RepID=A0AAD8N7E0_9APIA|nr:GRF-type domain-containing protein [Heracleum sosnowskyi]